MNGEKLHPDLRKSEFTLDDLVFPPCRIPDFEVGQVSLTTRLTERIILKTPLISSPMDTVTGHRMAILMACMGGIGVLHYNFPSINAQMDEVCKVRRFEAGFVVNPVVLGLDATVRTVLDSAERYGFYSYPITQDGTPNTPMVGFVTRRDVRYRENLDLTITEVMTPRDRLVVAHRRDTLDTGDVRAANSILRRNNLDTLPIIDDDFRVVALVTDSDLSKDERYPLATKDSNKQLKVLVAVESRLAAARERISQAAAAGASGIVVDARNIFKDHLEIARWTRKEFPGLDVIIGNAVTGKVIDAAMAEAGGSIDAFRIGMGTGETCVTTESLGLGRPLGSAIYDVDRVLKKYREGGRHIGLISDGGIKTPHHIIGAIALGANVAMMGSELAGLEESPIQADYDTERKHLVKSARGMGSAEVIRERVGANRYMVTQSDPTERYPEGRKIVVGYKGGGFKVLNLMIAGVRQGLHGLGFRNLQELYDAIWIVPTKKAPSKGTLAV